MTKGMYLAWFLVSMSYDVLCYLLLHWPITPFKVSIWVVEFVIFAPISVRVFHVDRFIIRWYDRIGRLFHG